MILSIKILALAFLSLVTYTANTTRSTTTVGVTYNPSTATNILPPPELVASTLVNGFHISSVNLLNPTPAAIGAFCDTNISLLLTVPNHLISSFAANSSSAVQWVYNYVLPFHPRAHISIVSLGWDVLSFLPSVSDPITDPSTILISAMENLKNSFETLGMAYRFQPRSPILRWYPPVFHLPLRLSRNPWIHS